MTETPKPADDDAELASALADGQLSGAESARALNWVSQTEAGRQHWQVYHMVGDVLRADQAGLPADDEAFVARLRARLQHEATPVRRVEAANAPRFHWARLAGVVLLVMGSLLGWQAWLDAGDAAGKGQLAQAPVPEPQAAAGQPPGPAQAQAEAPATMIRDPQLDALLAAHKQFGGASALQTPAGFLRNATFQGTTP
jgi:sigma-E factor negative regulatory protein RseA